MNTEPWAWGVQTPDGFRAVFVDHAKAEQYAFNTRGQVVPLIPQPEPKTC